MASKISLYLARTGLFFKRLRVAFLYHFRLMPRINRMKRFVSEMVASRPDRFPAGKSIFVFTGKEDNLYFVILREGPVIEVTEVFDDILNLVPDRYQILPKVMLQDILIRPEPSPL